MSGTEKRVILAVDDSPMQLEMFKKILSPLYELGLVKSACDALLFLNMNGADAVLLDIKMPNISGFDFLADIRRIPSYSKTPIIIVSGSTGKKFLARAKSSSAFEVLAKPVLPETLLGTIEKALG